MRCPAGCLLLVDDADASSPRLWGSFPYLSNSSVCLAAIHCGVISNSTGGAVQAARFYRQSWAEDDTQTVFPFQSHRGSLSNGVSSADVREDWRPTPADRFQWSATVRAVVGPYIAQRRNAPFSPRSEHVHSSLLLQTASYGSLPPASFRPFMADFIIGGRNATHFFNDVWVATRNVDDFV